MTLNQLQKEAFLNSKTFNDQVNGIVTQEAIYKANTWGNMTDPVRNNLAIVSKQPEQFGFVKTIVNDVAWGVSYDVWATDPNAQSGAISASVNVWWQFCTGFKNSAPTPEEVQSQVQGQGQSIL